MMLFVMKTIWISSLPAPPPHTHSQIKSPSTRRGNVIPMGGHSKCHTQRVIIAYLNLRGQTGQPLVPWQPPSPVIHHTLFWGNCQTVHIRLICADPLKWWWWARGAIQNEMMVGAGGFHSLPHHGSDPDRVLLHVLFTVVQKVSPGPSNSVPPTMG